MTKEGRYIYCITRASFEGKEFDILGINNREVKFLPYKDIGAVVSPSSIINFDRLDKKKLTKYVAAHQRVNEKVMKKCDVVPMAFGTIAPTVSEVFSILEKAYLQFKAALNKVERKVEFAVQVKWDQKKLLEKIVKSDPEIQKLKKEISQKKSILKMPAKLKLGKLLSEKAEIYRQAFIKDVQTALKNLAFDSTLNKLINKDMIANFSFLINRDKETELDKKMQELGKKNEERLTFKYIGPMPPYSFVKINLSLGNFEIIDWARKLLGLRKEATFEEIKKTYYSLSHRYHPDRLSGSEKKMKKIAQAYNILESYCRSCNEFVEKGNLTELSGGLKDRKYSFKEEDVKNVLIVK